MAKKQTEVEPPLYRIKAVKNIRQKIAEKSKKSKKWRIFFKIAEIMLLVGWVYASMMAAQWLMAWLFVWIIPREYIESNTVNAAYQAVTFAVCLLFTIIVPWKLLYVKTTRDEMGLRGLPTWTDILLAPVIFVAVMLLAGFLTSVMMAIFPGANWEQTQDVGFKNLFGSFDFIVAFICLVVLAPICEEAIFRGWLYGKMRARMAAIPAMIIVSLLFAVMHRQLNVGVTVFALSLGMCLQRELTGSIWSGILVHMIKNGIAFYFLFVV